jgi:hypothetical protein
MIPWRALELAQDVPPTASGLSRLAKLVGEEDARWAVQQVELRRRAKAKFADAGEMLFTREALEQATHERVAEFHANLFRSRLPAGTRVADLTTGIGSDLRALAKEFACVGFELDAERADYARHNSGAEVRQEDCLAAPWDFDAAYADPARRVDGRRTILIDEFTPDPRELSARMVGLELGAIKLTPMLSDAELRQLGSEILFVSFGGECREALVLTGRHARTGVWAVHLESGSEQPARDGNLGESDASGEATYLYEADPALIRAHATGFLVGEELRPLGDSKGYFVSDHAIHSPWVRGYRILYSGKGDWGRTKEALRKLDADRPVLKQRGTDQDLIKLVKTIKPYGRRHVAVVLWKVGRSIRHTIVDFADSASDPQPPSSS